MRRLVSRLARPATALLLVLLLLGATSAGAADNKSDKGKDAKKAAEAPAGDEKPFEEIVKGMEEIKGFFTLYRKAEESKVLMEILPAQMETDLLFAATMDQALGERGFYASMMGIDFAFRFRKVGKQIQWIAPNTRFTAPAGSPTARVVSRAFPYSIVGSAKVLSKPHPDRKSLLIDLTELVAARDFLALSVALSRAYDPTNYGYDKERSSITGVKNFEESALVTLLLHFTSDNPKAFSATLPDPRSAPFVVHYQFSKLPGSDFKPRVADERVGLYHTTALDLGAERNADPHVRHIMRWKLEKADPSAALSPPKEPIVFWLENTIPLEYRDPIREGALLWNKAFEKIGFKDAVVVKQQPDDATWDPADTRYSTIRWFTGTDNYFAIGPSRMNPYTGQIYDADIGWGDSFIRFQRRFGEEFASPFLDVDAPVPAPFGTTGHRHCAYAAGLAQQAAFGQDLLEARGMMTPEMSERIIREVLVQVTAHEVGHTLGFRHNFRGTMYLTPAELNDRAKVEQAGQTGSVMDYNPTVIAGKGQTQGYFLSPTLGPYDYWAVEYAYKPIDGDEKAELARIAAKGSQDPQLGYSTDEDADGGWATSSVDPLATRYDHSSDPLAFNRARLALVDELWTTMDPKLLTEGAGYQVLRRSLQRSLGEYARASLTTSKWIGGIITSRSRVGDVGGRPPLTPAPPEKQREAMTLLTSKLFSEGAFTLPASLLDKTAIDRLEPIDWPSYYNQVRFDYPWHDAVLGLQRTILDRLYHSVTLQRLLDNELHFGAGVKPYKMADMFQALDAAIWSDVTPGRREVSSLRRNLQREHLRQLMRLALREGGPAVPATGGVPFGAPYLPSTPEDATTLARANLLRIQQRARATLASKVVLESTTRAHLQETLSRVGAALDARATRDVTR